MRPLWMICLLAFPLAACSTHTNRANPVAGVASGLETQKGQIEKIEGGNKTVQAHIEAARAILKTIE